MKILKYIDFIKEAERAPSDDQDFFRPGTYNSESPVYVTLDVDGWIEKNKNQGSPQMFLDGLVPFFGISDKELMKLESLMEDPVEFYKYADLTFPGNYEMQLSDSAVSPMDVRYSLLNAFNDKGDPSQFSTVLGLSSVRAVDLTDDGNLKLEIKTASKADDQKLQQIEDYLTQYLERNLNPYLESKPISLGIGKPSVYVSLYSDEPEWFMKLS